MSAVVFSDFLERVVVTAAIRSTTVPRLDALSVATQYTMAAETPREHESRWAFIRGLLAWSPRSSHAPHPPARG